MKNLFSQKRNRQLIFSPKIPYNLAAACGGCAQNGLQFPFWCPREESNPHYEIRNLASYPLNDEGVSTTGILLETGELDKPLKAEEFLQVIEKGIFKFSFFDDGRQCFFYFGRTTAGNFDFQ